MARAVETAVQEPKSDFWEDIGPSTIATFVFAGLFGAGAILHLYQLWRYRAWHFIAFVIGAFSKSYSILCSPKSSKLISVSFISDGYWVYIPIHLNPVPP